jgi:GTPase
MTVNLYSPVGCVTVGQLLLLMPLALVACFALSGAEENDVSTGFVLCNIKDPVPLVSTFECQLVILELLEHNPIFTVGYR